jgi:hypothetical protein
MIQMPETSCQRSLTSWLHLIQAEYREMPGLNLTKRQMQRLWGLDAHMCEALIDELVAADVLRLTTAGSYIARGSRH